MTAASTRLSVMMFLEYLIWGSWLPLLALYLGDVLGFTGAQIGWVFATQAIACLFGLFDHEDAVRRRFGVPDDQRLVATVAIGQPLPDEEGRSAPRPRPAADQIIRRGSWTGDRPGTV